MGYGTQGLRVTKIKNENRTEREEGRGFGSLLLKIINQQKYGSDIFLFLTKKVGFGSLTLKIKNQRKKWD